MSATADLHELLLIEVHNLLTADVDYDVACSCGWVAASRCPDFEQANRAHEEHRAEVDG